MLCGIIDKHPNDKAVRRNLSQQVTKCETELANLQSDYDSKLSAYKTVGGPFARKIEADIVACNPDRYIVNGVKKTGRFSIDILRYFRKDATKNCLQDIV